jgi:CBS domain-containing protein
MLTKEILRIKGTVLYTIAPEGRLWDAVGTMVDNDIGSLVVMDHGRLVGMLTFREVLAALHRFHEGFARLKVEDVMLKEPRWVGPDMEVDDLRRTMLESHARYMPVMDGTTLVGVLSFHDVAKAVLEEQSFENRMLKGYIKNWPE